MRASNVRVLLANAIVTAAVSIGVWLCVRNTGREEPADAPRSMVAPSSSIASADAEPSALLESSREPATTSAPAPAAEPPAPSKPADELFLANAHPTRSDFERKYEGWDAERLMSATETMRGAINGKARGLMEQRLSKGVFDERTNAGEPDESNPNKGRLRPAGTAPEGLGRVWPCSQYEQSNGAFAAKTTYLTEAEYPQLFANIDEYTYVLHLLHEAKTAQQQH